MKTYNKLVRDGTLEHIASKNEPFKSHVADEIEYSEKLYEKLVEEAMELLQSRTIVELGDLLEVVEALKKLNHWSTYDVEKVRLEKLQKRGGFEKRIILEES